MEFSFVIPRANKDLLEDAEVSSYYVKNVYTHSEIPDRLRGKIFPNNVNFDCVRLFIYLYIVFV